MNRHAAFVLLLAFGIVFQLSHCTEVNVTGKDGKLCLYANLMVNFTVSYEITGNKSAIVEFELPNNTTTTGSECDAKSSTLKLNFGGGHSWSVNFTTNGAMYQADSIIFSYNLSDATVFPKSALNGNLYTSQCKQKLHSWLKRPCTYAEVFLFYLFFCFF